MILLENLLMWKLLLTTYHLPCPQYYQANDLSIFNIGSLQLLNVMTMVPSNIFGGVDLNAKTGLQNRNHFKQYLRYFKDRFNSDIQTVPLEQLRDMFGQEDTSLANTTDVKVVLFDNGTVDIIIDYNDNTLVYIPALPGDRLSSKFSSKSYDFVFEGDEDGITYNGTTYNNDT